MPKLFKAQFIKILIQSTFAPFKLHNGGENDQLKWKIN